MTNTELTKIREDKNLSKSDFAKLLGITPMLLGRYEKGSCAIPENIADKLQAAEDIAMTTETEVKNTARKGGGKAKEKTEEIVAEVKEAEEDTVVASEIEVKKNTRKADRKVKEAVEAVTQSDTVVTTENEVKKKHGRADGRRKRKLRKSWLRSKRLWRTRLSSRGLRGCGC